MIRSSAAGQGQARGLYTGRSYATREKGEKKREDLNGEVALFVARRRLAVTQYSTQYRQQARQKGEVRECTKPVDVYVQ